MLSSLKIDFPLEKFHSSYGRYCEANKLDRIALSSAVLSSYNISEWFDATSRKSMVMPDSFSVTGMGNTFDSFLLRCQSAHQHAMANETAAWHACIGETFGMELSATDYVPFEELKSSYEAFCDKGGRDCDELTAEFLSKYKMTRTTREGETVVTGLK